MIRDDRKSLRELNRAPGSGLAGPNRRFDADVVPASAENSMKG